MKYDPISNPRTSWEDAIDTLSNYIGFFMCFIMQNQCTILGSFYQPIQNTHLVKVEPAKDFRFVYHCLLSNPVNLHDCECQLGLVSKFMSSFSHSLGLLG